MNQTDQTKTLELDDIFRAAYQLCRSGTLKGVRFKEGKTRFVIEGREDMFKDDIDFRTGKGFVYPLSFKESYKLLEELSSETRAPAEEIDTIEIPDDPDDGNIDLLSEEEENLP